MTYQPLIPLPTDLLSKSQGDIKTNFTSANTIFGANHFPFDNATTSKGKHKFVSMPIQASYATILPVPVSGEGNLYTKTISTASELFYTPDATTNQYQLTKTITTKFAQFGTRTNYPVIVVNQNGGWTSLPGGMILQYGDMKSTGDSTAIVFPIPFTQVYSLTLSRNQAAGSNTSYGFGSLTTTGFNFNASSATVGITLLWIAVGSV